MSDDFIDKEEQNEKNIPTPENGHSDYKPTDTKNTGVKHQLSGMYQNWFLDYASYVILERAVPHINDGLKPVQRRILHSMKRLDDGRYNKVAISSARRCFHRRRVGTARPKGSVDRLSGKLG